MELQCTVRDRIFTCADKLTEGQLNLTHGTKKKNKEKLKAKTGFNSEETVRVIVREGSPGEK